MTDAKAEKAAAAILDRTKGGKEKDVAEKIKDEAAGAKEAVVGNSGNPGKRKLTRNESVSPPPLKRKVQVQSTTTKTAIASFFTPTSQKAPEKTTWQERAPDDDTPPTLLVGKYSPEASDDKPVVRSKIAAFDFDGTLIQPSSGKKHASDAQDWKWWHPSVPGVLRKLYQEDGYLVVIVSNQAGLTLRPDPKAKIPKSLTSRVGTFKTKVSAVLSSLDLPVSIYAATEKDIYRKPRPGMWRELLDDYDLNEPSNPIDLSESFFVGDAGGRMAGAGSNKDFACSDRDFAHNVGIKFLTPEEYFLKANPRAFERSFQPAKYIENLEDGALSTLFVYEKNNKQDIVLFCGSPGSGKSSFYWKYLQPLEYVRINQDTLKTRDKCLKVADEALSEGASVAIDNTNADPDTRAYWIKLAKKHNVPIRCVLFTAPAILCEHNDAVRALNMSMNPEKRSLLPKIAFTGFTSRHKKPTTEEGFQDIVEVDFKFQGTEEERAIWSRYWI